MNCKDNKKYMALLQELIDFFPYWDKFAGKQFFISGASGMIGSLLIDAIMLNNLRLEPDDKCSVLAICRNIDGARERFAQWQDCEELKIYAHNIAQKIDFLTESPDILIHAASTTHPRQYIDEPINTILANIMGTQNMLELAARNRSSRFLLLSSVEIYGENRGDTEYFNEKYSGYIDCNTLRAGYPEAKRVSEAMCRAYGQEKEVDSVIIRLPRCYGPTMRMTDSKAIAQFIKKGLAGEDIVLKSHGKQLYSYAFASDAVLGMLYVLALGKTGEAYNLADFSSDISLFELARLVADIAHRKVVFDLGQDAEQEGYSTATKAILDAAKLRKLGWRAHYDIASGIRLTMEMLENGSDSKSRC